MLIEAAAGLLDQASPEDRLRAEAEEETGYREWIAIDGSKFRAVASIDTAREKFQLQRYLDSMEKLDSEESPEFDNAGVQAALQKLKYHPEPEVGFMVMGRHTQPAYNLQSAVDAEHALIVLYKQGAADDHGHDQEPVGTPMSFFGLPIVRGKIVPGAASVMLL